MFARINQVQDVIYVTNDGVFVSPDGEGRYWYDSVEEARDGHGELRVVVVNDSVGD